MLWLQFAPLAVPAAEVRVLDGTGREVVLAAPARRIVSMTPHLTELLFAVGAGDRVVGAVAYSDFPDAAKAVPRVGDVHAVDLERILRLKPDLIALWQDGTPPRQIEAVRRLGVPLYASRANRLDDIAGAMVALGALAGTEAEARAEAQRFSARLAALRAEHAGKARVDVFYQVWQRPLLTVNGAHPISDVLALCGARNVFASVRALVPAIGLDAVLAADPEVIGTGSMHMATDRTLEHWRHWPQLTAVRRGNFFIADADTLNRQTPRILDAAQFVCAEIERARERRRTSSG